MPSFDVVSKINMMELENALNQTKKEIASRFDFQGTHTEVSLGEDRASILLKSASEGRVEAALDVLQTKMVKRGVSLRSLDPQEPDTKALGVVKQTVKLVQGINTEKAKDLIQTLKASKIKVTAAIQAEQLRVTGKNRDDLQEAIALLRQQQERLKIDLQFTNFRD
jgi:cyclic-di-GMP-binding protein